MRFAIKLELLGDVSNLPLWFDFMVSNPHMFVNILMDKAKHKPA